MDQHGKNTVSLSAEMRERLLLLKETERFRQCSCAEIARQLIAAGLTAVERQEEDPDRREEGGRRP